MSTKVYFSNSNQFFFNQAERAIAFLDMVLAKCKKAGYEVKFNDDGITFPSVSPEMEKMIEGVYKSLAISDILVFDTVSNKFVGYAITKLGEKSPSEILERRREKGLTFQGNYVSLRYTGEVFWYFLANSPTGIKDMKFWIERHS